MTAPKVLLLRAEEDNQRWAASLAEAGFEAVSCPLLQVNYKKLALRSDQPFDFLVLTSRNAVRAVVANHLASSAWKWLACVGPATAELAEAEGLVVHIVPKENNSRALASLLLESSKKGERFYYPTSSLSDSYLDDVLQRAGRIVVRENAYEVEIRKNLTMPADVAVVVFTSPSTLRGYADAAGSKQVRFISFGAKTTAAVRKQYGADCAFVEAQSSNLEGLLSTLKELFPAPLEKAL